MSFELGKLLFPFATPLGVALLLLVLALVLIGLRRGRTAAAVLVVAGLGLYGASTPAVADLLVGPLERQYPIQPLAETPGADVIVLLGGATAPALPPRQAPDLNADADRLLHAADLYKAGKAPAIIASGGNWRFASRGESEASDMAAVLERFGVPAAAIVLETGSEDTADNARLSAALMQQHGWRTALLVTSGYHMPRAVAVFRRAGVAVVPSASDAIDAPAPDWAALAYLPDSLALDNSSKALHELIGLLYYRLRGWA